MSLRPALRETSSAGSDAINLTPLLDVLFIILFFFLLATEARREIPAVEIDLPDLGQIAETRALLPESTLLVTLTEDGAVHLDTEKIEPEQLADRLARVDRSVVTTVLVRVDSTADSGLLVRALHAANQAGFVSTLVERAVGRTPPTAGAGPTATP